MVSHVASVEAARPLRHIEEGAGRPLVIMQGFGTLPETYRSSALLLGRRARVIVPALFANPGRWSPADVHLGLERLLDDLQVDQATLVAHSFGGGLALEFATRCPERVADLVFIDTLGMSREWTLAAEAARHPFRLMWMATPAAARDFLTVLASAPVHLARAAWWGFMSDRRSEALAVRDSGLATHVLWASRDSLLSRDDGKAFAADLGASFAVVRSPLGTPIDHDWLYRHPWLLEDQLEPLKLWALSQT